MCRCTVQYLVASCPHAVCRTLTFHAILCRTVQDKLIIAGLASEAAVSGYHADNVGPSLLGGFVLIRWGRNGGTAAKGLEWASLGGPVGQIAISNGHSWEVSRKTWTAQGMPWDVFSGGPGPLHECRMQCRMVYVLGGVVRNRCVAVV